MSDRLYAGVDPGSSGSLALLTETGVFIEASTFAKTEADIAEVFRNYAPMIRMACIEQVSSRPLQSSQSGFTFGRSYGFLRGMLVAFKIPFYEIKPQAWMLKMNCMTGGDKNISKAKAQQLWPEVKFTHGTADATLIAECCRRTHSGLYNSRIGSGDNFNANPTERIHRSSRGDKVSQALADFNEDSDRPKGD